MDSHTRAAPWVNDHPPGLNNSLQVPCFERLKVDLPRCRGNNEPNLGMTFFPPENFRRDCYVGEVTIGTGSDEDLMYFFARHLRNRICIIYRMRGTNHW